MAVAEEVGPPPPPAGGYCGSDNGSAAVFINEGKLRFVLASRSANRKRTGAASFSRCAEGGTVGLGPEASVRYGLAPDWDACCAQESVL